MRRKAPDNARLQSVRRAGAMPGLFGSAHAIDTGLASSSPRSELGAPSGAASFQTASRISAPSALAQRRASGLLLVLFAVSGCAALIYQVVWFQLLSFAIGASALSLGVLLPTYLGGLCIGSLLLPRYVSRKAHPLRVFGALELAIGALGVAALYLIPALGGIYSGWVGTGAAGLALRLLVAALALLPATILMGATLPAVAPWAEADGDGAARLGRLYAANVAGAVAGCVLAGFYLLRVHDAYVATFVAVALDIAVGLASFALAAMNTSPQAATRCIDRDDVAGGRGTAGCALHSDARTTGGQRRMADPGRRRAVRYDGAFRRDPLDAQSVVAFRRHGLRVRADTRRLPARSRRRQRRGRRARPADRRAPSARVVPTRALRRDRVGRVRDRARPALLATRRHAAVNRSAHARRSTCCAPHSR